MAENPPFGVEFTYYLNEKILSKKEIRGKIEKRPKQIRDSFNSGLGNFRN